MSHPQSNETFNEPLTRVVVYSREGCYLCADAIELVARVCGELGEQFQVSDVDSDPQLLAQYSDLVPVVMVDGVQQGFWRIDELRVRDALSASR